VAAQTSQAGSPKPLSPQDQQASAPAPTAVATSDADLEASLDQQIQTLLAQAASSPGHGQTPHSPPAAAASSVVAAPPAADDSPDAADDEARLIKQLDEMLASVAQEAIAADVQSAGLPDLNAARGDADLAIAAPPAAAAPVQSPPPQPVEPTTMPTTQPAETASFAAPQPAEVPAAAEPSPAVAATPTAPPAVAPGQAAPAATPPPPATPVGAKPTAFAATAADVERELQEQPKSAAGATQAAAAPIPGTASESQADQAEAGADSHGRMANFLFTICAALSRPAATWSPQARGVLGYIALLTLANGVMAALWGVVKTLS
jgi:hypothetical protein